MNNKVLLKFLRVFIYIIFPLILFGIIHLLFAYAQDSFDISEWSSLTRAASAYIGFTFMFIGLVIAHNVNNKK